MSYSNTITKEDLKNVLNEVLPFGWEVQYGTPTEITSATLISGYTATANGMFVFRVAKQTSGGTGYYYVQDKTTSMYVYQTDFTTNGTYDCVSAPMIKGHTYQLVGQSLVSSSNAWAIPFVATALSNSAMADYIVEQGTSGIWTYRKWNSGMAECWGIKTGSATNYASGFGGYGYNSGAIPFPSGLFNGVPIVNYTIQCEDSFALCGTQTSDGTTKTQCYVYWIRGTTGTVTYSARIYAIGTWK